jgi:acyl carrier protein
MLSDDREDGASGQNAPIETRVLELIAETCGLECGELSPATPLPEALDSLTLVAVVARVEAVFAVLLEGDETGELLAARDVGELGRLIARKVELARANLRKHIRNEGC